MRTSAGEKRFLRCTNAHPTKSGGRQPAVVRIRACDGERFLRTDYVSHRTVASRHHGWLTPAAPGARAQVVANGRWCLATAFCFPRGAYAPRSCAAMRTSFGEKRFLRCTNAHPTKSGGRQPAVVGFAPRGQCTASNVWRVTTVQSRSASARRGIVTRLQRCSCTDHRLVASARQLRSSRCERVSKTTGGLRPPLLCCDANVCRRKNDFCDAQTHIRPRAAGVSPPWVGFALATAIVYSRLSAFARHDRFPHHGGLTPPALVLQCERLPAKNDFCDAQTHIRPRAAGVSPPWFGFALGTCTDRLFQTECGCSARSVPAPRCDANVCGERSTFGDDRASDQERRASARRGMVMQLQRCSCTDHRPVASARQLRSSRCERVSKTTGGLRPPLLCCNANVCRRKNDFCDAQTHIRPRAAGVSPPWFGFALATAIGFAD
jgi:hypothetical protein